MKPCAYGCRFAALRALRTRAGRRRPRRHRALRFNACMHAHDHGDRLAADRRRLGIALVLIVGFMVVEVVGGLVSNSLSLLADAGHMVTDAASLALALGAAWLAATPATPQRSFGLRRAEILAALANGVALLVIAGWNGVAAVQRLDDPPETLGGWMVAVGVWGWWSTSPRLQSRRAGGTGA